MSFFDIVKAFIPLVAIIGMLYGVLVFIRKYGITLKGNKTGNIPINVLSSQMIMPKKFISVVKVADKLLILGVSEGSITLLKELDQPIENADTFIPGNVKNNFVDLLKKNLGIR